MYQALYRKYRPRTFDSVAGQEHITQTLKNQIASERASHAYLFVGTRGTGKTTCAKILARAVNCERPVDGNPCNECRSCLSIESGQATDVLEIDAASNNGVDNVRALRDEAVFSPASAKMRVYIIDEVHMLSGSAFNALLKILEEPPEHLLFILATTELHKVPATVVSRCQRFSFRRLSTDVISGRLVSIASREALTLEESAAALLSRLSDGSMRDAISLLDQCCGASEISLSRVRDVLGLPAEGEAAQLLTAIADRDAKTAFGLLDRLYMAGKQAASLFDELTGIARDALIMSLIPEADNLLTGALSPSELKAVSRKIPSSRLTHILTVLSKAGGEFTCGTGDRLIAEIYLASMCDERLDTWPEAVIARLEALESGAYSLQPAAPQTPVPVAETVPEAAFAFKPIPDVAEELPPWDIPTPEAPPELEPEPEKPPVITPEPETPTELSSEPESEIRTAPDQSGDIWTQLLARLSPSLAAAITNASAVATGGMLKITARDPFTHSFLGSDATVSAIREAASDVLGHDVGVIAELSSGGSDAQVKLNDLSSRFGDLMKFE